jgi:hypothetical protein
MRWASIDATVPISGELIIRPMTETREGDGDMAVAQHLQVGPRSETRVGERAVARRRLSSRIRVAVGEFLRSVHDVWDGSSWKPGHDWLTRVDHANGHPSAL